MQKGLLCLVSEVPAAPSSSRGKAIILGSQYDTWQASCPSSFFFLIFFNKNYHIQVLTNDGTYEEAVLQPRRRGRRISRPLRAQPVNKPASNGIARSPRGGPMPGLEGRLPVSLSVCLSVCLYIFAIWQRPSPPSQSEPNRAGEAKNLAQKLAVVGPVWASSRGSSRRMPPLAERGCQEAYKRASPSSSGFSSTPSALSAHGIHQVKASHLTRSTIAIQHARSAHAARCHAAVKGGQALVAARGLRLRPSPQRAQFLRAPPSQRLSYAMHDSGASHLPTLFWCVRTTSELT